VALNREEWRIILWKARAHKGLSCQWWWWWWWWWWWSGSHGSNHLLGCYGIQSCTAYCLLALLYHPMIVAERASEISVHFYCIIWHNITENSTLQLFNKWNFIPCGSCSTADLLYMVLALWFLIHI
jgi:hypothetical protein